MINHYKQNAVIVDLEGTLTKSLWRDHLRASGQFKIYNELMIYDLPNLEVLTRVQELCDNYSVILLSSKHVKYYDLFSEWMMRTAADNGIAIEFTDIIFKQESEAKMTSPEFKKQKLDMLKTSYNICQAIDDRKDVCEMYNENGITVWRIEDAL